VRASRDRGAIELVLAAELGDDDRARLSALAEALADELPAIAAGSELEPAGQARVCAWLASGLRGPYDEAFASERASSAAWFVALKLPALAALAVIQRVRAAYAEAIAARYPADEAHAVARAVHKLLDLETALLVHHVARESQTQLVERADLAQADRVAAIQTLSSGLAHEVRNPLNSAKLQLELLARRLRRDHDDPKLLEPVELAHDEIARLTRLLNEFLAFARPSALALGDHDVVVIAHGVLDAERPFADGRGIALALAGSAAAPARIDAQQVHQIVHNLVHNAVEAVPSGGHVTVTIGDDADHVRLAVEDDGAGIPEAVQHRIFEPFFSTKLSGTGLGLSIVHSAVALHGGTVHVASSARGTRFEVVLPRHGAPAR
jgi:signal transduction histidine kinase